MEYLRCDLNSDRGTSSIVESDYCYSPPPPVFLPHRSVLLRPLPGLTPPSFLSQHQMYPCRYCLLHSSFISRFPRSVTGRCLIAFTGPYSLARMMSLI